MNYFTHRTFSTCNSIVGVKYSLISYRPRTKDESEQNVQQEQNSEEPVKTPTTQQDPELRIVEQALARAQRLHNIHEKVSTVNLT